MDLGLNLHWNILLVYLNEQKTAAMDSQLILTEQMLGVVQEVPSPSYEESPCSEGLQAEGVPASSFSVHFPAKSHKLAA